MNQLFQARLVSALLKIKYVQKAATTVPLIDTETTDLSAPKCFRYEKTILVACRQHVLKTEQNFN